MRASGGRYSVAMTLGRRGLLKGAVIAALASSVDLVSAHAAQTDIQHGPRDIANVALTFHGAGAPDYSIQLLKIFAASNTPITVFAVGTWLTSDSAIGKRLVGAGHEVANHTMTHTQMKTISATSVDTEIARCAVELKKQIGNHGAFFRPSGTQFSTPVIRKAAIKYGYGPCISYEVDSHDFQDPTPKKLISNVMDSVQNGSIISLHFGHKVTMEAMPTLLEKLHAKGFMPVTVSQLLAK